MDTEAWTEVFERLGPTHGLLAGDKVRQYARQPAFSSIPIGQLAHIWELSDHDKDGSLSHLEFCTFMYLLTGCQDGKWTSTAPALPLRWWDQLGAASRQNKTPAEQLLLQKEYDMLSLELATKQAKRRLLEERLLEKQQRSGSLSSAPATAASVPRLEALLQEIERIDAAFPRDRIERLLSDARAHTASTE